MKAGATMTWDRAAKKALERAPFFVRPLVRRKVEERVRAEGRDQVTLADFQAAEAKFHGALGGRAASELERMAPRANEPGAPMVLIEACHHELSDCPNVLIQTGEWKAALEAWAKKQDLSERLRARVAGDTVYFHQKLRLAIAGCPNACSRPQIADFGLVGFVRPEVDISECRSCGACAEVCPDQAIAAEDAPPVFDRLACQGCTKCRDICPTSCISLSAPGACILAGGKLGRHPRFGEKIGEAQTPAAAIAVIEPIIVAYLNTAPGGERFADFWARRKEEAS